METATVPIKRAINGSTLKRIAIVSMLIDHVGATILQRVLSVASTGMEMSEGITRIFFSQGAIELLNGLNFVLRSIIGRMAFPIFCFLLVEGFLHTSNVKKYAFRLFAFALLSELPFDLAIYGNIGLQGQNVFFTLFIGFMTMLALSWVTKRVEDKEIWLVVSFAVVSIGMIAANLLSTDYAGKGVLAISVLYLLRSNKLLQIIGGCISFLWEPTALLAFIPIHFYNGERGNGKKYFFYLFYPLHLLVLYGICWLLGLGNA